MRCWPLLSVFLVLTTGCESSVDKGARGSGAGATRVAPTAPDTARSATVAPPVNAAADVRMPELAESRVLADALLQAAVKGERHAVYEKMDRKFQSATAESQFESVLGTMNSAFGDLRSFEFKNSEQGTTFTLGGTRQMRRLIYAIETSKHPKGTHFANVEVVRDPSGLAVQTYTITTFPFAMPQ